MATAHFNEENSADIVTGQNVNAKDERLRQVMDVITRHLHAAVKEIEPTQEEWMRAIQFLTATGHKCDDWRQEYILLSDVLGVSMLVDAINSRSMSGRPMTKASMMCSRKASSLILTFAAGSRPGPTAATGSGRSARNSIRCQPMDPSAGCSTI